MPEPIYQRATLRAVDAHPICVQSWQPEGPSRAVIQICHGLGEHADRYARFATAATARGYAACTHNHRGHGSDSTHLGYFADKGGWQSLIADVRSVNEHVQEQFPGLPVILLGHSMGSYIAQNYTMHYGTQLSGLLLSASTWSSRALLRIGHALSRFEGWRLGMRGSSALLNKLFFGDFNKPFQPARTELDWLSRDPDEVDKYVADPLCGGPYSCSLWMDLLHGMLQISSDGALSRIPQALPILITGGSADPVGGEKGMTQLAAHYRQTGHANLNILIYPDGRHEMLNEINRDQVMGDWLNWVDTIFDT